LGGNLNAVKRNAENLLVAGKEVNLEVDTKKTIYIYIYIYSYLMSRMQEKSLHDDDSQ
jgi:hypothetical protein